MTISEAIRRSAKEMVDRLGSAAIDYMHERIAAIEKDGTPRECDQAYLLLTAVEQIFEQEPE